MSLYAINYIIIIILKLVMYSTHGPGSYFGESSFFTDLPRKAGVLSVCYCQVERLDFDDLDAIINEHPILLSILKRVVTHKELKAKRIKEEVEAAYNRRPSVARRGSWVGNYNDAMQNGKKVHPDTEGESERVQMKSSLPDLGGLLGGSRGVGCGWWGGGHGSSAHVHTCVLRADGFSSHADPSWEEPDCW